MIFDVQRCSRYDGPGIRTTVFLKGCPLRCLWCHNPESQSFAPVLALFEAKCARCGACAAACPKDAHRFDGERHAVDRARCKCCGRCASVCSEGAIKIYGQRITAKAVMEAVMKDAAYYRASGGGITLSGGEPLSQPEFLCEVLARSKENGLNTCVETSGFAPSAVLERAMPLVDLFLFDIKAPASLHRALIGVDVDPMRANLRMLLDGGARVLLRCPIVPALNDTDEHFQDLAALVRAHPQLAGLEFLPYHDLGKGKAAAIGRRYALGPTASEAQKQRWKRQMRAAGLPQAAIEGF